MSEASTIWCFIEFMIVNLFTFDCIYEFFISRNNIGFRFDNKLLCYSMFLLEKLLFKWNCNFYGSLDAAFMALGGFRGRKFSDCKLCGMKMILDAEAEALAFAQKSSGAGRRQLFGNFTSFQFIRM